MKTDENVSSHVLTRRDEDLAISHEDDETTQFEVPIIKAPLEFTNRSISDDNSKVRQIVIDIKNEDKYPPPPFPTVNPRHAQFHNYPGILYLIYAASLLYMFPSLIALVELKFQNKAHSAFETHGLFANMAVVAYIIAIPTSVTLFSMKARLESSTAKEKFCPVYYKILQSVFYVSSILAPLSFVVVLFFPHGFDWIGYSIISTLIVIIFGCCFGNYIKLLCKKDASNLKALQGNETSSQSALDISE